MKTSTFLLLFVVVFASMASSILNQYRFNIDPINVEINIGKGADCFARGQLCATNVIASNNLGTGPEADAIGKAYFNNNDQFVLELNILLTDAINDELSDGGFNLEENFQLPNDLVVALGRPSETVILNTGIYDVETIEGNSYRIVFN